MSSMRARNLLFWAIVLLTYIISPHGELYLLEKCATCLTQYDALQCLASVAAEREAEMSIEATEKKCEYIVIIYDVLDAEIARSSSDDVMSVYIDFNVDAVEIICVSIQTSIHRLQRIHNCHHSKSHAYISLLYIYYINSRFNTKYCQETNLSLEIKYFYH